MNYKTQLKKRIEALYPTIRVGRVDLAGTSFSLEIENIDINLRQLEQELREALSMPGLLLTRRGE
jgi:hypothetical protein